MTERFVGMSKHFATMHNAVYAFGERHNFRQTNGYDPVYRIALMSEELGEISECITKDKGPEKLGEELADMLILLIGTAIGCNINLEGSFWAKIASLEARESRLVNGRVRMLPADKSHD